MLKRVFPTEPVPEHVQVEVTWRCNWRCVHCYQDTHQPYGPGTGQLLALVQDLAANGTSHLIITGGEPLVRPDLLEVLAAARAAGLAITLYTNGHLIDPPLARRLGELLAGAELSVLSGEDRIHDQLAGRPEAAARVWQAVTLLRDQGVAVTVKTPLLAPAVGTFQSLLARCVGVTWHPDADITASYGGAAYPLRYRLTDEQREQFYQQFPAYDPRAGHTTDPGVKDGICLAGRRYCFVDVDGNVFPCLNFKSASDRLVASGGRSPVVMGNAFTQPFSEIWAAPVASYIQERTGRDFRRCASCTGQCSPCMAQNYERTGELFDMAGSCLGRATTPAPVFVGMPRPPLTQGRG